MSKNTIFRGAATALITPMTEEGVDFPALGKLIDWQIDQGIDALVIAGTTGEKSTLNDKEHRAVLEFCMERIAGRVPMIAGTGSNDTAYCLSLSRHACEIGADALLVVTPYYNKATQNGLIKTYNVIADASTKPVIVYNIPSRTGVGILPETYAKMAEHPNIAAIKEANGDISKIVETAALVGDRLDIYSGDDDQIVPILSVGGMGVISTMSNVIPKQTAALCAKFFAGDIVGAAEDQKKFLPLIRSLFCEVNPIPVKAAMAKMGFCSPYIRLPLTEMEPAHAEVMFERMRALGLIEG